MKEPRNANLVEPQIGRRLIGSSLFTFNNANKVFAGCRVASPTHLFCSAMASSGTMQQRMCHEKLFTWPPDGQGRIPLILK